MVRNKRFHFRDMESFPPRSVIHKAYNDALYLAVVTWRRGLSNIAESQTDRWTRSTIGIGGVSSRSLANSFSNIHSTGNSGAHLSYLCTVPGSCPFIMHGTYGGDINDQGQGFLQFFIRFTIPPMTLSPTDIDSDFFLALGCRARFSSPEAFPSGPRRGC